MKHKNLILLTVMIGSALTLAPATLAQTVRLHGAVAMAKVLNAQKAAFESKSGATLEIVGNGAGRGLADLNGGLADVAMLAGTLKDVADAMNKEKPGSVDTTNLREVTLTSAKAVFVAHPSVNVKSVTDAQLRGILTGQITNWKEVGGADLPIKNVLPFGADGTRVTAQSQVLQGAEYDKKAIIRNSSKDVVVVVTQLPGACAVLTVNNVEGNMITIAMEKNLAVPWALVTKGEPSSQIQKVIEAAKTLVK